MSTLATSTRICCRFVSEIELRLQQAVVLITWDYLLRQLYGNNQVMEQMATNESKQSQRRQRKIEGLQYPIWSVYVLQAT